MLLRHFLGERNGQAFRELYASINKLKPSVTRETIRGELWRLVTKEKIVRVEGPHLKKRYYLIEGAPHKTKGSK